MDSSNSGERLTQNEDFIKALMSGDEDAWSKFYQSKEAEKTVRNAMRRYFVKPEYFDDIMQICALELFKALVMRGQKIGKLKNYTAAAWKSIAYKKTHTFKTKLRKDEKNYTEGTIIDEEENEVSKLEAVKFNKKILEDIGMGEAEEVVGDLTVREILEMFPENRAELLIACVMDGKSFVEIAKERNMKVDTLKSQYYTLIKKVGDHYSNKILAD